MRLRLGIAGAFACFCLLLLPSTALATSFLTLTVVPVRAELSAQPGTRVSTVATLTLSGVATRTIDSSVVDFVSGNESGKPKLMAAEQSPWSMSRWVSVHPDSFRLGPAAPRAVEIAIDVPKDAEPGGHYSAVLLGADPGSAQQARVTAKVGVLLLLTVAGKIQESGTLALSTNWLYEHGSVPFDLRFNNTGNVHVKPSGQVRITTLRGDRVTNLRFDGANALPRSSRTFNVSWASPGFGIYLARAEARFGRSGRTATSNRRLIVVAPWRLIAGGLTLFLLGYAIPVLTRKARRALRSLLSRGGETAPSEQSQPHIPESTGDREAG